MTITVEHKIRNKTSKEVLFLYMKNGRVPVKVTRPRSCRRPELVQGQHVHVANPPRRLGSTDPRLEAGNLGIEPRLADEGLGPGEVGVAVRLEPVGAGPIAGLPGGAVV